MERLVELGIRADRILAGKPATDRAVDADNVIDLMEALKRSLERQKAGA